MIIAWMRMRFWKVHNSAGGAFAIGIDVPMTSHTSMSSKTEMKLHLQLLQVLALS